MAFLAGLAAGNWQGQLVPYFSIHPIAAASDAARSTTAVSAWEVETGWYALFSSACVAVIGGIVHAGFSRRPQPWIAPSSVLIAVVGICAAWLTEWPQLKSQPWVATLLAIMMLLNGLGLNRAGQSKLGAWVPLIVGTVWCGSATILLVLAHSARFADLAILPSCALVAIGLITLKSRPQLTGLYIGPVVYILGLILGAFSNTYSDIPWISFALIAVAPALCLILYSMKCQAWFEARPFALAILLLLPCVVALGLAMRAEIKGDDGGHTSTVSPPASGSGSSNVGV